MTLSVFQKSLDLYYYREKSDDGLLHPRSDGSRTFLTLCILDDATGCNPRNDIYATSQLRLPGAAHAERQPYCLNAPVSSCACLHYLKTSSESSSNPIALVLRQLNLDIVTNIASDIVVSVNVIRNYST